MEIYREFQNFPISEDYPYQEPTDYEEIISCTKAQEKIVELSDEQLYDKLYGAWLGRCIGCAVGQPVEGLTRSEIRRWCDGADAYPLNGYIPTNSRVESDTVKLVNDACTTQKLHGMPSDDDIRFTILGLDLLKKKGADFDTWDVGTHWLERLPLRFVCTAETQSYLNFANIDVNGPWKVRPDNATELARGCASYLNPYREWIGAQIRIDAFGYVAAGNPALAAKLAYQDASLSHVKNGVYGAMFFSALIAAAFTASDIYEATLCALSYIPQKSRFYEAAKEAIEIGLTATSDENLLDRVLEICPNYNWVHTINNAAICIATLIYTKGELSRAVPLTVMAGLDTDCNGATVGSIAGAFQSATNIPKYLTDPLCDIVYSEIPEYHPIKISTLAQQTLEVGKIIKNT